MTVDPRSPESSNPSPDAAMPPPPPQVRRWSGRLAGMSYEAEECPDGRGRDGVLAVAGGGGLGWLAGMVLGMSPVGRIIGALVGAGAGAVLSRFHFRLDWDPDKARDTLKAAESLGGLGEKR